MDEPGDRRPVDASGQAAGRSGGRRGPPAPPPPRARAIVAAVGVALVAAAAWALLRGILELGPGLLAVAGLGGWGIAAILRRAVPAVPVGLPIALAVASWLLALVGTWLVSLAILPASTRTLLERIEATPFLEWMGPQLGLLEIAGLALFAGAAAYGMRRR